MLFRSNEELIDEYVVKGDEVSTFLKLKMAYDKDHDNIVYFILNSEYSPLIEYFGLYQISFLTAVQEGASDRVKISYKAKDPGLCFHTTRIALEVIMRDVKTIKSLESDDVVDYFNAEASQARSKLDNAEAELSALMTKYNIINYYEQTKWLAKRKEDFDLAFQEEKLKLAAARAAEIESEKKLSVGQGIAFVKQDISNLRRRYRDVTAKITLSELDENYNLDTLSRSSFTEENLDSLINLQGSIRAELEDKAKELYTMDYSVHGVNFEDISKKWVEAVVDVEKFTARISQYEIFKRDFDETYTQFASLGSRIKQMERKIGVLEEDYLDLLRSLNDSKLMKQNIEMSTNLRVIDPPFYPVNAEQSKKLLFTLIGGVVGFLLILVVLILMEFVDESIKTPARLARHTDLEVTGGFPLFSDMEKYKAGDLLEKLTNQIITNINYNFYLQKELDEPYLVLFLSTRKREGKTNLAALLAKEMRDSGESTLFITAENTDFNSLIGVEKDEDDVCYTPPSAISDVSVENLSLSKQVEFKNYRYIFFEVPAIIGADLPIKVMKSADLSFLIVNSCRKWNNADEKALISYQRIVNHDVTTIINGTDVDELESIIGEIPKERNILRKKIKQFAKLQFKSNPFNGV